jgi:chemotaxis signal transduction protein
MIGRFVDRILDAIAATPAKIETAPKVAWIERLDSVSGIGTIDSVTVALTELANLLTQPEVVPEEKAATQ